ncbi:hypothetical protein TNCV_288711 [Trichonephila clavipes]|nr:hypothetical protein TNCV_288711 [Trichonephila clavipes]
MISCSQDNTGLPIETSLTSASTVLGSRVAMAAVSAAKKLNTYVGFRFIGAHMSSARCTEYVHASRSSSRS